MVGNNGLTKCVYSVYNIHIERGGQHGKETSKYHDYR